MKIVRVLVKLALLVNFRVNLVKRVVIIVQQVIFQHQIENHVLLVAQVDI